jgi:LPS export ABC transporter permease LptF
MSLTLVMVLGNITKLSNLIINKGVSIIDAAKILMLFIPYILSFTIPLSILMAILLTIGRLAANNELVAMRAAGISIWQIFHVFFIIGIVFSLFLSALNNKVIPYFHYNYHSYLENIYKKNVTAIIEPGVYMENFENTILYVGDIKENKLKNVFIYEVSEKGLSKLTYAKQGEFVLTDDQLKIKLENGFRDEINPKNKQEFYRVTFKVCFTALSLEEKLTNKAEKKPSDMVTKELKQKIRHLQQMGIDPLDSKIELYKRNALSFSPLTFIILGFGISLIIKHREKSINFGLAVVAAGIYYLLLLLGETLAEFGYLQPILSMWLANIIITSIGAFLIFRNVYSR